MAEEVTHRIHIPKFTVTHRKYDVVLPDALVHCRYPLGLWSHADGVGDPLAIWLTAQGYLLGWYATPDQHWHGWDLASATRTEGQSVLYSRVPDLWNPLDLKVPIPNLSKLHLLIQEMEDAVKLKSLTPSNRFSRINIE